MIKSLPHIAAMSPYTLADAAGPDVVSLAQNESAFPASPAALAAGREALSAASLYPDPDWTDLRHAIAGVHGIAADDILCGAGSMELISALLHAYAGPGADVLATDYGYAFVATVSAQVQSTHIRAREEDMTVSVDAILDAVTDTVRMVFVCNPGNPTGTMIPVSELARLRDALPSDLLLVVDQAYGEFADPEQRAAFGLVGRGNTVVLRTFSKAYGLAGMRVGWGLFPTVIATEVRKLLSPNNISAVSQAAATAAMQDQAWMRDTVAKTAAIRDDTATRLRALGYGVPDSHSNFLLIRFADETAAHRADHALRQAGLLLRGMTGYGLPECLRATIGPAEAMARLVSVLSTV